MYSEVVLLLTQYCLKPLLKPKLSLYQNFHTSGVVLIGNTSLERGLQLSNFSFVAYNKILVIKESFATRIIK